jgi:hypothetical protein
MKTNTRWLLSKSLLGWALALTTFAAISGYANNVSYAIDAPKPLLEKGRAVDWWFVFKFNTAVFPGCGGSAKQACIFDADGEAQDKPSGQQFVFASSANPILTKGNVCAGDTTADPIGATFDQVYNDSSYYYVVWNDQFYDDPKTPMCGSSCGAHTAHSKGMLAWNDEGEGFVLQVSTPSWPGAGNKSHPRQKSGNTLGCIAKPNNILVSQHFFALKLTKEDLVKVLKALQNASIVTDPKKLQVVKNGGPADVRRLVDDLGTKSDNDIHTKETLSSGVIVISKAPDLYVPPWQMASAVLGGVGLRAATWWNNKKIYSTNKSTKITCWDDSLSALPGAVEIALSGKWAGKTFELKGGGSPKFNHAKIGVSTSSDHHFSIFSDMNQEGSLSKRQDCTSSQNKRGGIFYVVDNERLFDSMRDLIGGETAPTRGPRTIKKKK